MLYAYFGGLGADKQATYELVLEQSGAEYTLTAHVVAPRASGLPLGLGALRGVLRWMAGPRSTRVLYRGQKERRALLMLLQAACAANLAEHGQRYCYVLPSAPCQPGALAPLVPHQLRYDGSLPLHPQLWQDGRPLDTLPLERHGQARPEARGALIERSPEERAARHSAPLKPGR